ncbi:MAG: hypothetical protein Q9173_004768 [Seirophora scorigena]
MEYPEYDDYGAFKPVGSRQHHRIYSFDSPKVTDPLAPYALPINGPPVRGSRYHLQRGRSNSFDRARDRRRSAHIEHYVSHGRRRHRHASHQHFSDDSWDDHTILTDPSVESDFSEPLSEDSFTFDGSVSDSGKAQAYVMTDESLDTVQSMDVEPMDVEEKKPPKPSPYTSLGPNVLRSRFVGDPLAQWSCAAELSIAAASKLDRISKPLFQWVESENAAALMHQIRHRDEHSIPTREGKYLESGLTTWYPSFKGFARKDVSRIHFLCMPYFSLSPYIGDKYVTTADAHPLRSLLQTQYPSASMERDMLQAVCQLQGSSQRHCYHVPQIWCLWVEDSMETCVDALHFAANTDRTPGYIFTLFPRRDPTSGKSDPKDRSFSPSGEESSEQETGKVHQTRSQARSSSPTVAGSASKAGRDPQVFDGDYEKIATAQFDFTETEEMRPRKKARSPRARHQEISDKDFHLFYWLNASPAPSVEDDFYGTRKEDEQKSEESIYFTLDTQRLEQKVSQLQSYLKTKNRVGHRAYIQCPSHGLDGVEARKADIVRLTREKENSTNAREREEVEAELRRMKRYSGRRGRREVQSSQDTSPDSYRDRRSHSRSSRTTDIALPDQKRAKFIVKISKQLFAFFFPLAFSSSMTKKYWGAIHWLLHQENACDEFQWNHRDSVVNIRAVMQPLARAMRLGPPPGVLELPIEFSRAWIHLLTFWVLFTVEASSRSLEAESSKCLRMLEIARIKVFQMRVSNPLHTFEVALPPGIVSLIVNKLVGGVTSGTPDIEATYYAYVTKLVGALPNSLGAEQEVQQKPYNRGHQEKISSVRQEISCVLAVLEDQDTCVSKLRSALIKGRLDAPPGFPQRREAYILQQCLASISDRMQNFRALDERARGIAAFNLYRIESNRDRQEGAILVFTIVTIIFLPLSFVSSFFGMNVADIRDMARPQWVFWASAVPLTALVVGISFFVARKIEPLKDWWQGVAGRWKTKPVPGGWYPAPAVVQAGRGHSGRVGTGRVGTGLRERRMTGGGGYESHVRKRR